MLSTLAALIILTAGVGIYLQLNHTPKTTDCKKKRANNRTPVLKFDDAKSYKFPPNSYTPGQAFQYLAIENSDVPLHLIREEDLRATKGYVRVDYSIPLLDSWTRLQRHLVPLQTVLSLGSTPLLTVANDVITMKCVYSIPTPTWKDITDKLRPGLAGHEDTVTPYLSQFQRFRITGGSEAGKSPTAKNIALALAKKYSVRASLSNPQSNSNKNYWGEQFEVVATTHVEQYELILSVAEDVITRGERPGNKPFKIYIFDELDSTVAFLSAKELKAMKNAVLMIIKQASHQNICVLFLGQTSAANLLPGTTKSDWMSLVTVAIGATGYDAISKSPALTAKRKAHVTELYELAMRKAETFNKTCNDRAIWIRPAVVFDPTSVEIVVLPAFI